LHYLQKAARVDDEFVGALPRRSAMTRRWRTCGRFCSAHLPQVLRKKLP
jgi:hypothetical protein